MKRQNQTLSEEQMKELYNLGLDLTNASLYINCEGKLSQKKDNCPLPAHSIFTLSTPLYTLQDVLEIIGYENVYWETSPNREGNKVYTLIFQYPDEEFHRQMCWGHTPLEAAYVMLLDTINNKEIYNRNE